jgi:hypothetical protein
MEVRDANFYDLIKYGLGTATFQQYVDTMFADKYSVPDTPGFAWEPDMQDDFNFTQVSAKARVYTMATYTDVDSEGPLKSTGEFELGQGKIPRMKHRFNMNEAKIRKHMLALSRFGVFDNAMRTSVENLLFESTDQLIGGNYNSLKYQRHQAVSKGKFDILASNNPQGITGISINFHVPAANKWENDWWNATGAEVAGVDPIKTLKDKVHQIRQTEICPVDHIEVNKNTWDNFLDHSAVRTRLGYLYSPLANTDSAALALGKSLLDDAAKVLVERFVGCPITVIDSISCIDKFNASTKKVEAVSLQSFEENVFVFLPAQTIGSIVAVRPIVIDDPASRIAFYDGGRTVITQLFDARHKTEEIGSELTALCVPSVVRQMYYLTVKAD